MAERLSGHSITCDHFYTLYALGEELVERKGYHVGDGGRKQATMFAFTHRASATSYCPWRQKNMYC